MIQICRWDEFQHFKKRDPIWIKLYRKLRNDRKWRTLPAKESKMLVDLWMLAADGDDAGKIHLTDEEIAWELRMDPDEVRPCLEVIATHGFIKLISERYQSDSPHALARDRGRERDRDRETTATASPAEDVENSGEKRASESPLWTDAEILELAYTVLGRRQLTNDEKATNKRILQTWLYSDRRDRTDIVCAIEGAADMRDKSMIGWEGLGAKDPMTLKALNGPRTLADQGDGKAQRDFFDVAVEHTRSRRQPRPPPNQRGGGPKPIGDIVQATGAA